MYALQCYYFDKHDLHGKNNGREKVIQLLKNIICCERQIGDICVLSHFPKCHRAFANANEDWGTLFLVRGRNKMFSHVVSETLSVI